MMWMEYGLGQVMWIQGLGVEEEEGESGLATPWTHVGSEGTTVNGGREETRAFEEVCGNIRFFLPPQNPGPIKAETRPMAKYGIDEDIVPRVPLGFFNPIMYPAASTPGGPMQYPKSAEKGSSKTLQLGGTWFHQISKGRVMDGPPIEVILNHLTMFHLVVSPLIIVLDLLDITLSLFVTLNLLNITLNLLDDTLNLLIVLDLHHGNIDVMMMASNSNPRHPDGWTWDYRQHNQEPLKLPKAPSSPVQSASLKEQLAPSTPSGHMGVDQAPSKLPTANCAPPTCMSLDESIPQATVPDPPGQHPRSMPDSFSVPLEVVNNVQSSQGTMEMDSAPPEVPPGSLDPVVPVGQWFHIKFTGVTAEVNMKEVFQSLVEDHLIGI
ncbi:hypothetical protein BS47DRAFT_1364586 [Hydnum rufescens UP504]|uniref:Uncharacterized protein n=1 Tax=Hydnum rufescens UP504 TaxID=1448309 RepID=A0A9P6DTC1_9AGAM|nr:hypothetical protein BS47DRAFT_1364586 [Hydnum rufescens UP504]